MSQQRGDELITCVQCKRPFIWSYGEQQYFHERGLSTPKRCSNCRQARKQAVPSVAARQRKQWQSLSNKRKRPFPPHNHHSNTPLWWYRPLYRYFILFIAPAIVTTLLVWLSYGADPVLSWLGSISLFTFIAYGYDKLLSKLSLNWQRVPETVLNGCALIGGTPGALLGAAVFRHKTQKTSFQVKLLLVIAVQCIIVVLYLLYWQRDWLAALF